MRKRQPFKLRRFAAAHNAILFSLSLYMSIEVARQVCGDCTANLA